MRVAIDARPLTHPQAGGYRSYVRALIRGLAERAGPEELLLYVDRPLPEPVAATLPAGAQVRVLDSDRLRTDFVLFPEQVRRDKPDLVFGTVNYLPPRLNAPTALAVLDALLLESHPWQRRRRPRQRAIDAYWAALLRRAARRARRLVTLSHASAAALSGALGRPLDDFAVIPCGITLPTPRPEIVRAPRSVLAIAQPDPRKNLETLYDALSRHAGRFGPDGPPTLGLVATSMGACLHAEAALARRGVRGVSIHRLPDDQNLSDLYARATVFAFPSRREGFGLPPLEAMRAGAPVIASNAEPLPEVLGDAPVYASPDDAAGWADALAGLLDDPDECARRATLGRAHAARFTCLRMAQETADAWREALA